MYVNIGFLKTDVNIEFVNVSGFNVGQKLMLEVEKTNIKSLFSSSNTHMTNMSAWGNSAKQLV